MTVDWEAFAVAAVLVVVVAAPVVRAVQRRVTEWKVQRRARLDAACIMAGCDLDVALEQFFWDEGCWYGHENDAWDGTWDGDWLDVADAAGVTPEPEQ